MDTLFSLLESEVREVQLAAAIMLKKISESTQREFFTQNLVILENYLPKVFDYLKSRSTPSELFDLILDFLANLCQIDYLKSQIFYMEGIFLLTSILRNPGASIRQRRSAVRGLFNMSCESREWKVKVISELSLELSQIHSSDVDPVIKSLLMNILKSN